MKHGTESGYRIHGCRCDECRAYKSRRNAANKERRREQRAAAAKAANAPDDGIVDWVVVERLAAGVMDWHGANRGEREDAARRMLARGEGWDVVTLRTGLRHTTVKRLRDEVAA